MSGIATKAAEEWLEIQMPKVIDQAWAEEFSKQSSTWLLKPTPGYLFNCADLLEFKSQAYRQFVLFAKVCRDSQKRICSLYMNDRIQRQIAADGLIQCFNPVGPDELSRKNASAELRSKKKVFDVSLINPFVESTRKTLELQARTPSTPGKPYLLPVDDKTNDPPISVAGVITIATAQLKGSVTLTFSERVILGIYENMFGEKHAAINSEVEDAVGELLNIIYGGAKSVLNHEAGFDLQPALPTVLSGEKLKIRQRTRGKILILPFGTGMGPFHLEVAMEENDV